MERSANGKLRKPLSDKKFTITISCCLLSVSDELLCVHQSFHVIILYITMHAKKKISPGSQVLLDNAERYGLYLARSLNDTNPAQVLSRKNIGIITIIEKVH